MGLVRDLEIVVDVWVQELRIQGVVILGCGLKDLAFEWFLQLGAKLSNTGAALPHRRPTFGRIGRIVAPTAPPNIGQQCGQRSFSDAAQHWPALGQSWPTLGSALPPKVGAAAWVSESNTERGRS